MKDTGVEKLSPSGNVKPKRNCKLYGLRIFCENWDHGAFRKKEVSKESSKSSQHSQTLVPRTVCITLIDWYKVEIDEI